MLLAGPDPVAEAAGCTVRSVNEEYAQQRRLQREEATDIRSLAARHRTEHLAMIRSRAEQRDAFVTAARGVLEVG